jgi:OOP family OmpA-OmpF porin
LLMPLWVSGVYDIDQQVFDQLLPLPVIHLVLTVPMFAFKLNIYRVLKEENMRPATHDTSSMFRLSAFAVFIALSGQATQAQENGWYGGISGGESRAGMDDARIVAGLQTKGYSTSQFSLDKKDLAAKVFGGYSFNRNFAVEAGYFDLGNSDFQASVLPSAVHNGKASINGFNLDLVGTLPLGDYLSAFVRAGINTARIEQNFSNSTGGARFADHTERHTNEKYGVGLEYAITDTYSIRAELERYRIDENLVTSDHVDTYTIGFVYRLGARRPAPPVAQLAPQPAPAPLRSAPVRITLSASALFDFDRSELKPAGIQELDKLVADLEGLRYEVIIVTGHTDRIGARDYNLALSDRRANTVRDYLVNAGIPGGNITARGVNSDEPVTTPQQCQGPVSDALKACLQPDRRVEVDVSGTRDPE